jgi:hypothetical protein
MIQAAQFDPFDGHLFDDISVCGVYDRRGAEY